jgi:membrane protein DedA with SNARE-associated domain
VSLRSLRFVLLGLAGALIVVQIAVLGTRYDAIGGWLIVPVLTLVVVSEVLRRREQR